MISHPIVMQHNVTEQSGILDKSCLADRDVCNAFKAHSVLNLGTEYTKKTNIKKWYMYSRHFEPYMWIFPYLKWYSSPTFRKYGEGKIYNLNIESATKTYFSKNFGHYISKLPYFYEKYLLDFIYHWFIHCEFTTSFMKTGKYGRFNNQILWKTINHVEFYILAIKKSHKTQNLDFNLRGAI